MSAQAHAQWKREWLFRRIRHALIELGIEPQKLTVLRYSPTIYLVANMNYDGEDLSLFIPLDRLGKRVSTEILNHWIPGILANTISHYDCLTVMLIFAHKSVIKRYRSRITRHLGLLRDEKLRRWAIWKKLNV